MTIWVGILWKPFGYAGAAGAHRMEIGADGEFKFETKVWSQRNNIPASLLVVGWRLMRAASEETGVEVERMGKVDWVARVVTWVNRSVGGKSPICIPRRFYLVENVKSSVNSYSFQTTSSYSNSPTILWVVELFLCNCVFLLARWYCPTILWLVLIHHSH